MKKKLKKPSIKTINHRDGGMSFYEDGGELPLYETKGQVGSNLFPAPSLAFQNAVQNYVAKKDEEIKEQQKAVKKVQNKKVIAKLEPNYNNAMHTDTSGPYGNGYTQEQQRYFESKKIPTHLWAAEQKKLDDAAIIQRRKDVAKQAEIDASNNRFTLAGAENASNTFRAFPNDPNSFFDEWINPLHGVASTVGNIMGNFASDAGPIDAKKVALDALPLAGLFLAGAGSRSIGQALNNAFNPLAGFKVGTGLKNKLAQSAESGVLSNAYKINPFAFKPKPNMFYRQIGEPGLQNAIKEGKVLSRGQKEFLENNPEFNYWNEYNEFMDFTNKNGLYLKKPTTAPFFQKGELFFPISNKTGFGRGKTAQSDVKYLLEGQLPDEAIIPRYRDQPLTKEVYYGPTGGTGVLNSKYNDLSNFNTYKKDWLKGYKPIQTSQLKSNIAPVKNGFIDFKGALQKYPKGPLTQEEINAFKNSPYYQQNLQDHLEKVNKYGDDWKLPNYMEEHLNDAIYTGNRQRVNPVLYGGRNWKPADYITAGIVGTAFPGVLGLHGLVWSPPAVRSRVLKNVGIQGVPGGLSSDDTTIDMTNRNMNYAKVNQTADGNIIIGGEFIEDSNNTVRKAKDWITANDTYSDKNYPSKDIQSFYGVEKGKFKVGKASDFNPDTEIVPRRFGEANIASAVLNGNEMRLLDKEGKPIYQNTPNTGKFILYSPSTGKTQFTYINSGKSGVDKVNAFLKQNKDAQYIHLDNGRYEYYGINSEGLTDQDFKNYYEQDLERKGTPGYNLILKENGGQVYANGGPIKPTWSRPSYNDSLSLYKTALSANNFYGNEFKNDYNKLRTLPYEKYLKLNEVDHTSLVNLYNKKKQEYNILKNRPYQYNKEFGTSYHTSDLINKYKNTGNFTGVSNMLFGEYDPYFNPNVPVTYLHPGILPQKINQYESRKFTDAADVPYYDPIAIKPYKLLTPKERELREQRYGKPVSNITKKPKSIISKVVEETPGPKVVREIPAPLNPAYKPRTTGIPFLLSDEVVNTTTPMTPSVPVAPVTTTSKTPMTANPTKWFSLDGSGNKVLIDNQYLTRDEFEKFKVANPNFNYSQKPDSVGRKYNMGGGIELSNRMFEEGGEYELTNEEIKDLQSRGYDIELL